jgi:hypothetical protein
MHFTSLFKYNYVERHDRFETPVFLVVVNRQLFLHASCHRFGCGLDIAAKKLKPLKINTVAEAFLSYYMLFPIGISNLINFVFHVFFGDTAAKFIGWENSPFQAEVGFASLGSA